MCRLVVKACQNKGMLESLPYLLIANVWHKNSKCLTTLEESQASLKDRPTSQTIIANYATGYSTPPTWVLKTRALRHASVLRTSRRILEGMEIHLWLNILTIPSYHVDINIDTVIAAITDLFGFATGLKPKFKVHGGSYAENIALQNIQVSRNLVFEQSNVNTRPVCVCCFHIFSPNCFHGCAVERAVY